MRWLISIILLFWSASSQAVNLKDLSGKCGNVKVYISSLTYGSLGRAGETNGEWWIKLSPFLLRDFPAQSIHFVFFHECGHVVLQHQKGQRPFERENAADCYAAKRFISEYGEADFDIALKGLFEINGLLRDHWIRTCKDR